MENKKIYLGVGIIFLLILSVSFSYAYFSIKVSGNDNAKDVVVTAGTLSLVYTDGPEIKVENIRPGKTITKEVSVKNTGTLDTAYNIVWQELSNEITNDEMLVSAACERLNASGAVEGTCESISQVPISDTAIAKKISIESGITHKYTFTILFKETNENQNYNQGKKFSGVLGIEESKGSATPASFSTDTWDTIVSAVKSGDTSVYNVGDTKTIDMGTYGTHTVRIANTTTPSECNTEGFSQSACGFVLEFADIITTHNMNSSGTYKGTQYDYGWNVDGWPASSMYTFVNNDIYNALPSDLKSAIIDTTVVSSHGSEDTANFISTDKLYLLSTAEVWAQGSSNTIDYDTARDVTRQLDYYKNLGTSTSNYSGAIKKNGTSASYWWFRSASSDNDSYFYYVYTGGDWIDTNATNTSGVAPAFRLG